MNLLVVEDEGAIREGVREYLTEQGFHVLTAEDGVEALEVFEKESIDLILLDIMMPRKNGFEVLEEVRKTSKVPILMLTALHDEETQVRTFELLVDGSAAELFVGGKLAASLGAEVFSARTFFKGEKRRVRLTGGKVLSLEYARKN